MEGADSKIKTENPNIFEIKGGVGMKIHMGVGQNSTFVHTGRGGLSSYKPLLQRYWNLEHHV